MTTRTLRTQLPGNQRRAGALGSQSIDNKMDNLTTATSKTTNQIHHCSDGQSNCCSMLFPITSLNGAKFDIDEKQKSSSIFLRRSRLNNNFEPCQIVLLVCVLICIGNPCKILVDCLFLASKHHEGFKAIVVDRKIVDPVPSISSLDMQKQAYLGYSANLLHAKRAKQESLAIEATKNPKRSPNYETRASSARALTSKDTHTNHNNHDSDNRINVGHQFSMIVNGREYKLEPPSESKVTTTATATPTPTTTTTTTTMTTTMMTQAQNNGSEPAKVRPTSDANLDSQRSNSGPLWSSKKKVNRFGQPASNAITDRGGNDNNNYGLDYESGFEVPSETAAGPASQLRPASSSSWALMMADESGAGFEAQKAAQSEPEFESQKSVDEPSSDGQPDESPMTNAHAKASSLSSDSDSPAQAKISHSPDWPKATNIKNWITLVNGSREAAMSYDQVRYSKQQPTSQAPSTTTTTTTTTTTSTTALDSNQPNDDGQTQTTTSTTLSIAADQSSDSSGRPTKLADDNKQPIEPKKSAQAKARPKPLAKSNRLTNSSASLTASSPTKGANLISPPQQSRQTLRSPVAAVRDRHTSTGFDNRLADANKLSKWPKESADKRATLGAKTLASSKLIDELKPNAKDRMQAMHKQTLPSTSATNSSSSSSNNNNNNTAEDSKQSKPDRLVARDLSNKLLAADLNASPNVIPVSRVIEPGSASSVTRNLIASSIRNSIHNFNPFDSAYPIGLNANSTLGGASSGDKSIERSLNLPDRFAASSLNSIVRSGPIQFPAMLPMASPIMAQQPAHQSLSHMVSNRIGFNQNPFGPLLQAAQFAEQQADASGANGDRVRALFMANNGFGLGSTQGPSIEASKLDFSTTKPTSSSLSSVQPAGSAFSGPRYASGTVQDPLVATANHLRVSHLNPSSLSESNNGDDSSSESSGSQLLRHSNEHRGSDLNHPIEQTYESAYGSGGNSALSSNIPMAGGRNSSGQHEISTNARSSASYHDMAKPELKPREGIYGLSPTRPSMDQFELEMANSIGISPGEYERDLADLDEEFNRHSFRRPVHPTGDSSFMGVPERYESRRFNRIHHPAEYPAADYLSSAGSIIPRPYISGADARSPAWPGSFADSQSGGADYWASDSIDFSPFSSLLSSPSIQQAYRWSSPRYQRLTPGTSTFSYTRPSHHHLTASASDQIIQPAGYNYLPANYAAGLPTETVSIAISPLAAAAAAAAASAIATADKSRQAAAAAAAAAATNAAATGSWFTFPRFATAAGGQAPTASSVSPAASQVIPTTLLHRPSPFAALSSVPIYAIARPPQPAGSASYMAPLYHTAGFPILTYRPAASGLIGSPSSLLTAASFGYPAIRLPMAPGLATRPGTAGSMLPLAPTRSATFGIRPFHSDLQFAETKPKSNSSSGSNGDSSGKTPFGKGSSLTAMAKNLTKKMFGSGSSLKPQHLAPTSSIDGFINSINPSQTPFLGSASQLHSLTRPTLKIK